MVLEEIVRKSLMKSAENGIYKEVGGKKYISETIKTNFIRTLPSENKENWSLIFANTDIIEIDYKEHKFSAFGTTYKITVSGEIIDKESWEMFIDELKSLLKSDGIDFEFVFRCKIKDKRDEIKYEKIPGKIVLKHSKPRFRFGIETQICIVATMEL